MPRGWRPSSTGCPSPDLPSARSRHAGRSTARLDDETVTAGRLAQVDGRAGGDPRPARPAAPARRPLAAGPAGRLRRPRGCPRSAVAAAVGAWAANRAVAGGAGDRATGALRRRLAITSTRRARSRPGVCDPGEAARSRAQLAAARHGEADRTRRRRLARRSSGARRRAGAVALPSPASCPGPRPDGLDTLADRLAGLEAEAEDVAEEARVLAEGVDHDPERSPGWRSGLARSSGSCAASGTTKRPSSRTENGP